MNPLTIYAIAKVAWKVSEALEHKIPVDFFIRKTSKEVYGEDSLQKGGFHAAGSPQKRNIMSLVANNHRTVDDVYATVAHELAGHYLANTYSLKEKSQLMGKILATKGEPSLAKEWAAVEAQYPNASTVLQCEELLAHVAQQIDIFNLPPAEQSTALNKESLTKQDLLDEVVRGCHEIREGKRKQQVFMTQHYQDEIANPKSVMQRVLGNKLKVKDATLEQAANDYSPSL